MHLNKLLEQIKRHQSPLKSELAANMYEAINGPHFDEEHARCRKSN